MTDRRIIEAGQTAAFSRGLNLTWWDVVAIIQAAERANRDLTGEPVELMAFQGGMKVDLHTRPIEPSEVSGGEPGYPVSAKTWASVQGTFLAEPQPGEIWVDANGQAARRSHHAAIGPWVRADGTALSILDFEPDRLLIDVTGHVIDATAPQALNESYHAESRRKVLIEAIVDDGTGTVDLRIIDRGERVESDGE